MQPEMNEMAQSVRFSAEPFDIKTRNLQSQSLNKTVVESENDRETMAASFDTSSNTTMITVRTPQKKVKTEITDIRVTSQRKKNSQRVARTDAKASSRYAKNYQTPTFKILPLKTEVFQQPGQFDLNTSVQDFLAQEPDQVTNQFDEIPTPKNHSKSVVPKIDIKNIGSHILSVDGKSHDQDRQQDDAIPWAEEDFFTFRPRSEQVQISSPINEASIKNQILNKSQILLTGHDNLKIADKNHQLKKTVRTQHRYRNSSYALEKFLDSSNFSIENLNNILQKYKIDLPQTQRCIQ